jgi:signal transduction histidine kinase
MTAYADLQAAIDAINQGHVLRYLTKPWKPEDLTLALDEAVELVRMRRTIGELQARVMRGSEPLLLEGALRNVASQLDAPVARLEHGAEQVGDLLDAGLGSWEETGRARQLVEHAREAQRESERPVAELRDVVQRLERGQRLVPLVPSASCDVARVARAALHVARGALGPEVKLQLLLTDTPAAGIEAADLGQALLNVLTFASQHGEPSGGRLVHVSVGASAAFVEIVVGQPVGALPAEGLARLFDPHARVAGAARGVGLALARQLLERAGGSLHAESTPQGGLQYVLRIAAADPHPLG